MHPDINHNQTAQTDSDVHLLPVPVQGRVLPMALINARAATRHPENCMDLNRGGRRGLHALLAFYNLKTKAAVFPYREVLAQEAGVSIPTIQRDLAELEAKGYIVRLPQRHKSRATGPNAGKFWLAPISLTDKALLLLGLNNVIHKPPSIKMIDGIYIDKEHTKESQSSTKNTIPAGTSQHERSTKPDDIDPNTRLPKDLLSIRDRSVTPLGIFKLMGLAKRANKRLSDIVAYRKARIETLNLTGNDLYRYLLSLIDKDIDYAYLAPQSRALQEATEEQREIKALQQRLHRHYDGFEVWKDDRVIGTYRATTIADEPDRIETVGGGSFPVNDRIATRILQHGLTLRRPDAYAE